MFENENLFQNQLIHEMLKENFQKLLSPLQVPSPTTSSAGIFHDRS